MDEYQYHDADPTFGHSYLWPAIQRVIQNYTWDERRAFDLGCGNGSLANRLSGLGFSVTGVDTSTSGVALANETYPHFKFRVASAYDDLTGQFGTFPLVISLEVIEHCYDPRTFARNFLSLIAPGGLGILSTPYHGYLKNVALAALGKMDAHYGALWDGGHIKFFSIATLRQLFRECGAGQVDIYRVGRVPIIAKSMIAVVSKSTS